MTTARSCSQRKLLNRPVARKRCGCIWRSPDIPMAIRTAISTDGFWPIGASTLRQVSALCTTPDGAQGGVWQGGAGLASEDGKDGRPVIYAAVGNRDQKGRNLGQSILQLGPAPSSKGGRCFFVERRSMQLVQELQARVDSA